MSKRRTAPGRTAYDDFVDEYVTSSSNNGLYECVSCGEIFEEDEYGNVDPDMVCSKCIEDDPEKYYRGHFTDPELMGYYDEDEPPDVFEALNWDEV